jgi:hypothetical protein
MPDEEILRRLLALNLAGTIVQQLRSSGARYSPCSVHLQLGFSASTMSGCKRMAQCYRSQTERPQLALPALLTPFWPARLTSFFGAVYTSDAVVCPFLIASPRP